MTKVVDVLLPDIGDFEAVDVIEVLVSPGDVVAVEDSLITLESDKATMEIPSPHAGTVREIKVAVGDKIGKDAAILTLELGDEKQGEDKPAADPAAEEPQSAAEQPQPAPVATASSAADIEADVVVLGAGPGGYTAAFRSADLGRRTVLVERYPSLGGVCLNVGCIPSKALLHTAAVISEAGEMGKQGVSFGKPKIDLAKLRTWKGGVVSKLTGGLSMLAKKRKVQVVQGLGRFESQNRVAVETPDGVKTIAFQHAIIATGSSAVQIQDFPNDDDRVMDSTDALELQDVPKRLLVIGGGIIGLEMATVYDALGSRVTVVEAMDGLIPGCDRDLVRPLQKRIGKRYENIYLGSKVARIQPLKRGLKVFFEGAKVPESDTFDRVLVAVGRRPNTRDLEAPNAGVNVTESGFIPVDRRQRTNVANIYAIGDVVGNPMLAHKATHEGKVAAEVIAGLPAAFDALTIPSVAYTDPEVAWMGLTETQAAEKGIAVEKATFPWAASGRALSMGREDGLTKLLFDKESKQLLGAGITGINAGELISELVIALEMGADAQDIGLSIHPHPTLSETVCFAAEMVEGTITDLYIPRR